MAVLLGFILRMAPARHALIDGAVLFYGYDSFYHMRRILYTADLFPHTLWFDSYLNYPRGLELMWPPLFDQLISGSSHLLGANTQRSVELVGAIVPPILGTVAILALYFLAKELFGRRVALISAFMMAISPRQIDATGFGHIDHHVLEILLLVSVILFLVLANSRKTYRHSFGIGAGVLMAALAYTWLGAPAYSGFFLIYMIVQTSLDIRAGKSSRMVIGVLATAFGVTLLLMLPFWKEPWIKMTVLSTVGILAAMLILYALSIVFLERAIPWQAFPVLSVIMGYFLLMLAYLVDQESGVYWQFREGVSYFFGGDLSNKVVEAKPFHVMLDPVSLPAVNFVFALIGLLALILYLWHAQVQDGQLLFLIWTLSILALTLAQNRFLYIFSANMAILIAFLFVRAMAVLDRKDIFRDVSPVPLKMALLLAIFLPSAIGAVVMIQEPPEISGDWVGSLTWLENNTPTTSGFDAPSQVPEYGVMSWWDYGNWILYRAHRPVVANNFQAGAKDAARFFLSESEDDALNILESRRSKYVITSADILYETLPSVALWIDEEPSSYVRITDDQGVLTFEHSKRFLGTVLARCHLFDCTGMSHLRLIYESPSTTGLLFLTNEVKIFERVPGAKITGTTRSEEPVGVILNITTNQGRRFRYYKDVLPEDGRYEIKVPYSTESRYETHSEGLYHVFSGNESQEVKVGEEDVLFGKSVELNF